MKIFLFYSFTVSLRKARQADLRDIVSLVPDHRNKAIIAIKQVIQSFGFPSAYESYVYTILWSVKCAIALCLKK